jgi:hypothetical protein
MWNSTKIKREQRRLDDMVTNVGMPPSWEAIGRDKKGWVYRWRKGESFVEHCDKRWYWYTGIKTKHMKENGAFTCPVACAVACELTMAQAAVTESKMEELGWSWVRQGSYQEYYEGPIFVWAGGNDKTRYNIRPWKKSNGTYVWRCHHPAFKTGDEFLEFLDPVSCAVAQEVQGE